MSTLRSRLVAALAYPFTTPPHKLRIWHRPLRYLYDFSRLLYRQVLADRAMQMAAALSFRTIFSLLPMIVLALVVFQSFAGLETYRQQLTSSVLHFVLPPTLLGAEQTEAELHVEQQINLYLEKLGRVNFGAIGIVGLLVFIYGATTLLATIEQSFNTIFRVQRGRPWYLKLTFYYTVVTLGPLVLAAGQFLESRLFTLLQYGSWTNWLVGPLAVLSPLITTWIVLWAIFMLLPRTDVWIRSAAVGSLIAASLWVVSKELFAAYVSRTAITSLYGALGLIPLFLWWIYLTWLIVLVGLEIAYTLQIKQVRGTDDLETKIKQPDVVADPHWTIPIMVRVGQAFDAGQAASSREVADDLALPPAAVARLMSRLQERGLLRQVADPDAQVPRYVLAMPPQKLPMDHLLQVAHEVSRSGDLKDTYHWRYVEELRAIEQRAASQKNLADLMSPPKTPHPADAARPG